MTGRRTTAVMRWSGARTDVVVLRWPDQADEVERLDRVGVPRLLLVEPGVAPPSGTSCLEDWLRLPADGADIDARLMALAARGARHAPMPALDEHGQLSFRGMTVFLSPVEQRLAEVLLASFGRAVATQELMGSAWSQGGTNRALRVHISRLRGQIAPLGLAIRSIKGFGYLIRDGLTADGAVDKAGRR